MTKLTPLILCNIQNASYHCVQTAQPQLELALRRIYCMIEFSLFRLPLDMGVFLIYIKCINSINTLLTYLIHFEQQEIANHARLKFLKFNFSSTERKEVRCDFY